MGVFDEVAIDLGRAASWLDDEGLTALTHAGAQVIKKEAIRASVRAIGGDRRMSHFGGGRPRAGIGYDVVRPGFATMNYRPPGMWQLLEYGANPHQIGGPKSRGRRKGKRSLLSIDGDVVIGPIRHPGTKPKRVVTRAMQAADTKIPAAIGKALNDELARILG